jgi:uncharacterized protein with HEPN domain
LAFNPDDAAHLWDMLDAARAVRQFMAGATFERYQSDRMLRGAVERHLEIIGEAARRVSAGFRESHPEIPWRQIIAQRNILAHEYGDVDDALVWRVAMERIGELITSLTPHVPPEPTESSNR